MNYEKFFKNKLIKKQVPDFRQIQFQLQRSMKDLKTDEANLTIDLTWGGVVEVVDLSRERGVGLR